MLGAAFVLFEWGDSRDFVSMSAFQDKKEGLVRWVAACVPCGHEGFSIAFVWAACAAGGRWGPVEQFHIEIALTTA